MDSIKSHSNSKYRKYNEKMVGFFYTTILMSIGIAVSVYGTAIKGTSERLLAAKVYYILMYLSSTIIIAALWIYFFINRHKTYESLINGENEDIILSKRGENVNMYLRFGLAMFGILSLIYVCVATYIRQNYSVESIEEKATVTIDNAITHGVSQGLFITVQTIFILLYHRLITLVHKNFMKFALLHLMITNMLMWVNASIGKVSNEFETSQTCSQHKFSVVCKICVYLLPTVSEYTVIAAAVLHEVYLRIGKISLIELEQHKSENQGHCSRTLFGIMGGIALLSSCMFSSIASVPLYALHLGTKWIYDFHSSQMIILNILAIALLVVTYLKVRKMKFSVTLTKSSLDKNVLYVSYIMAINFSLIVTILCGHYTTTKDDKKYFKDLHLRLFSALFEIIQASMQTYFIIECFQRCSYDNKQKEEKPGKNCLAILTGINFGMWFLWTLQIKNADIIYHKTNSSYTFISNSVKDFSGELLTFFLQSTLPLGMLFRYHSSACLSDIYSKIYQTESERFVDHLRAGKLANENGILSNEKLSKKHKNVEFGNTGFEYEDDIDHTKEQPCKVRSQSVGIIPFSVLKEVNKKMSRRQTIKNMEEAQYKFISEQISHQMIHKKMSPHSVQPKESKPDKRVHFYPNVNKMIQESFFTNILEETAEDSDNDSAYSI